MSEEKKTPLEVALEKDCIFLLVAEIIDRALRSKVTFAQEPPSNVKCRGPECAEFDWFNSRCGFSK